MICPSCQTANDDSLAACARCGAALGAPTSMVVAIDLKPGAVLDGRYEIQQALGRGGMGMVYRARDRSLDEIVAIKVLRPDFAQDPKMAERFRSEIKLARRVRHKNVCAIHDYGEAQGVLYISMELIEGRDLKHVLRERGAFSGDAAYQLALQVAEGLQAVHDAGIIHRDLKTPNIMLDDKGVARLLDFGIARRQEGGGSVPSTATGHVLGTPEYMSPEQAHGTKVDHRTDIYALGILIYEIFTGQVPFQGDTPISTILKHLHEAPPLHAAGIPPALQPVLRRALAKDPQARYPTTRALADALREARDFKSEVPTLSVPTLVDDVLTTPAMAAPAPAPVRVAPPKTMFQPWLLVIPVALASGVLLLNTRVPSSTPPPTTASLPPVAATPPESLAVPQTTIPATPATSTPTPIVATARPAAPTRPAPRPSPLASLAASAAPVAAPLATTLATTAPPTTVPATMPAEPGQLQLAIRPWAEVSVDGRVVGTTPLDRLSLPAGSHVITLRHPAYEELQRSVTLRSGETAKLVVDLAKEATRKRP